MATVQQIESYSKATIIMTIPLYVNKPYIGKRIVSCAYIINVIMTAIM